MEAKIKLYAISRKHTDTIKSDGTSTYNDIIQDYAFPISRQFETEHAYTISLPNALKILSWLDGWNFIRFENMPQFSKANIIDQIRSLIQESAVKGNENMSDDQQLREITQKMVQYFATTLESMASSILDEKSLHNVIPTNGELYVPPTSIFKLLTDIHTLQIPHDQIQTWLLNGETPHELLESGNVGVNILKAQIFKEIKLLERAIVSENEARDELFKQIQNEIGKSVFDVHQLYMIYMKLDDIKQIKCVAELHQYLNKMFLNCGNLLGHILSNPNVAYQEFEKFVAKPAETIYNNLQELHKVLNKYLMYTPNALGRQYPYGNSEVIAGYLFQIMLFLMTDMDKDRAQTMCIHIFGCIFIDIIFNRVHSCVWSVKPPRDMYIKSILEKYNEIYKKYRINSLHVLRTSPQSMQYQQEIQKLITDNAWDPSYFDFLLSFNFSSNELFKYNIQSFAKRIREQHPEWNIDENNFCCDIREKLLECVGELQKRHGDNDTVFLYDKTVMFAVFKSHGVQEIVKQYNGGELYYAVLSGLSGDGK